MLKAPLALLPLLFAACAAPTTEKDRMATVLPVFMDQLERVEDRLMTVEHEIGGSAYSEESRRLLARMIVDIRTQMAQTRFAVMRAGADVNADALEAASDEILDLFEEVERLYYVAITSDFEEAD